MKKIKKQIPPFKKYMNRNFLHKLVFDPHYLRVTCYALLVVEFCLNILIIERIRYTEIDWIAYMQEVEGFLNGTLDYRYLKGATGPLVYPAGFLYVYTLFYYITSAGNNIRLAQYIFLLLYVTQLYFSFRIYEKTVKVPPYALVLTTLTSYRIHSIYVLRLFNDPIAVLLFYIGLNCFISGRWKLGSVFYSLAVSVKMNVLLYAPCLLIAYLTNLSLTEALMNLTICAVVQLFLGMPFLLVNPVSYVKGAFDLGRVFEHKWTVNYRFLSRNLFENFNFHVALLFVHLLLLWLFYSPITKYLSSYAKLNVITGDVKRQIDCKKRKTDDDVELEKLSDKFGRITQLFVLPFFVTNLIGIACARSLHYQFYSWYFHSLLYLVHCTGFRRPVMFLLLALIEYCWNVYPSTNLSSLLLHFCHIVLICGVYRNMK